MLNIERIIILFSILLATACVKETGQDDCPPEESGGNGGATAGDIPVLLYIDFAENLYTRASSPADEVESIYVFVFGHDGHYLTTLIDTDKPVIGSDYVMEVPLEPGDYEFIGWSNLHGSYILSHDRLVVGETTVEELFVELDVMDGDTIRETPGHLHYGLTRNPYRSHDSVWEYMMEIDRYTYTVNIITEGLPPDNDDYRYVIADRNGRFSFYSQVIPDRTVFYVADCDKDSEGQLSSSLRILRLLENNLDSKIYIENVKTGLYLFEDNLIQRLLSLRDIGETVDFTTRFEYTIRLIFDAGMLVEIRVNDWTVFTTDEYEI